MGRGTMAPCQRRLSPPLPLYPHQWNFPIGWRGLNECDKVFNPWRWSVTLIFLGFALRWSAVFKQNPKFFQFCSINLPGQTFLNRNPKLFFAHPKFCLCHHFVKPVKATGCWPLPCWECLAPLWGKSWHHPIYLDKGTVWAIGPVVLKSHSLFLAVHCSNEWKEQTT